MSKLKIIPLLLSLLIAIQMLPIARIGSMLSQNQWTEELPHDISDDFGKAGAFPDFNHPYLPPAEFSTITSFFSESKALAYIHTSEQIPSNHSTEVVIPPPDAVI